MNQDQTTTAGERTRGNKATEMFVQCNACGEVKLATPATDTGPQPEEGGIPRHETYDSKTAKEWFDQYELMRKDFGRVIAELEAQDRRIKQYEADEADRQRRSHPLGVSP